MFSPSIDIEPRRFFLALCFAAIFFPRAALEADSSGEWPQWRGAKRDGKSTETGFLKKWPEGGPKLLWKAEGVGAGYSSFSILSGRLYTMGSVGADEKLHAFELATGKLLWSVKLGDHFKSGRGGGPRGTPTLVDGLVYTLGTSGWLGCYKAADGAEVWKFSILERFGSKNINWGLAESVLIEGNLLICGPGGEDSTVVALDRKTGETVWKSEGLSDRAGYASAVAATIAGKMQVIHFNHRSAVGVSAADGGTLWRYTRVNNGIANCATPVVVGEHVFLTSDYGAGCALLNLNYIPKGDGNEWLKLDFVDAKWASGKAPVGYGESAIGEKEGTIVGEGLMGKPLLFRRTFAVAQELIDSKAAFKLSVASDNSATVWINGQEVDKEDVDHEPLYWNRTVEVAAEILKKEGNLIAVRVNNNGGSSDAFLDLQLDAEGAPAPVIAASSDGWKYTVGAVTSGAAKQVYSNKDLQNHHGGVIYLDGKIYGHSGGNSTLRHKFVCMDFKTGKVLWEGKGLGKCSIVWAEDLFYCLTEDGKMGIAKISPAGYELVSSFVFKKYKRFKTGGIREDEPKPCWTHPVVAGGKLFLRDQDNISCYDISAK